MRLTILSVWKTFCEADILEGHNSIIVKKPHRVFKQKLIFKTQPNWKIARKIQGSGGG